MTTLCRKRLLISAAAGLLLVGASTSFSRAADFPPLVDEAFQAMAITPSDRWAYHVTTVDGDGETVERFDPSSKAPYWTLLQVDGGSPDKADLRAYDQELKERELPNLPDDFDFANLVDRNSLVLESEDDQRALFRFDLLVDGQDDEDISAFLKGRLVINKSPAYVAAVEFENEEAFSPEFGVTIIGMKIDVAFEPLGDDGPYFLSAVTEDVDARAYGFMKVAETETISVGDYVYVGR